MQTLSYGVFGLGNKQYEHFCAVGKRVHKALGALGAKALVRRGDGDDDEDIEADFESWRTELYAGLDKCEELVKSSVSISGVAVVPFLQHSITTARGACCMLMIPPQRKGMLASCCLNVPI